jgi:hypothetical protein
MIDIVHMNHLSFSLARCPCDHRGPCHDWPVITGFILVQSPPQDLKSCVTMEESCNVPKQFWPGTRVFCLVFCFAGFITEKCAEVFC